MTRERIAQSRILIDQARLLVMHAAWKMDHAGNKAAKQEIAMIKVAAPAMALQVIDWVMQLFGAASCAMTLDLPTHTRARGRCASQTVLMKSIATPSPSKSWRVIRCLLADHRW